MGLETIGPDNGDWEIVDVPWFASRSRDLIFSAEVAVELLNTGLSDSHLDDFDVVRYGR